MPAHLNGPLLAAAFLSAIASLLHLGIVFGGAPWYRFFGAGEKMANAAEAGSAYPTVVTLFIAAVLAIWSAYALAGAGVIGNLPWLRTGLVLITLIYTLRGAVLLPVMLMPRGPATTFGLWSSAICLVFAATHATGLFQVWARL